MRLSNSNAQLALVLANVALYAACYQAQTPITPYIVKSLSPNAQTQFGVLKSWNGLLQLLGGLFAGRWIDIAGARPALIASFAASAVYYILVARADSFTWLLVAQIPTVLQHAVLGARGYVALSTTDEQRTKALSYISVAYGVGMVVGPSIGGALAKISLQTSAVAAAVGSLISVLSLVLFLEVAPTSPKAATESDKPAGEKSATSLRALLLGSDAASAPLRGLICVKALMSAALALFHSTFVLVASDRFGMDAQGVGYLMSFVGALGIASQSLLVGPLTSRFSEGAVVTVASSALAASFAGLAAASTQAQLYAVCVPLTVLSTIVMLINTSQITRSAPPAVRGSLVAVDMALGSGFRMVAPAVGAHMLSSAGYWSMGAASAGLMGLATLLLAVGVGSTTRAASAPAAANGKAHRE